MITKPAPKISCITRCCGNEYYGSLNPRRPPFFSKKLCFNSFFKEFKDCDFHVVWDGEENDFYRYLNQFPIKLQKVDFKSNQKSLLHCYELINDLDSEWIVLNEDDWFYLPDSFKHLGFALDTGLKDHIFCLYDRPHGYLNPMDDVTYGNDFVFFFGPQETGRHWRTVESCMYSFCINKSLFSKLKCQFIDYCVKGNGAPIDRGLFRYFYKQKIRLFAPIPSLATHCIDVDIPFGIDWAKAVENLKDFKV